GSTPFAAGTTSASTRSSSRHSARRSNWSTRATTATATPAGHSWPRSSSPTAPPAATRWLAGRGREAGKATPHAALAACGVALHAHRGRVISSGSFFSSSFFVSRFTVPSEKSAQHALYSKFLNTSGGLPAAEARSAGFVHHTISPPPDSTARIVA